MTTAPRPTRPMIAALVALLCLIWGSTWLVIKTGLDDLPPFTSVGVRFAIAAAIMAVVAPIIAKREGGAAPPAKLWVPVGVTNFTLSYGLVYWGETVLPSGLASLLWAVFPLMMAAAGHFWLDEQLRPRQLAGFLLGFAGVALLFGTDLRKVGADAIGVGAIFLLSPLVCCVGTVLLKRHGADVSSALVNRNGMSLSALLLLSVALVFERDADIAWTGQAWFSIFYLAIAGTCVTFGLYFWLLRHAPASRMSLIAYVSPCIALILGWLLGGEPVYAHTIAGAVLTLLGVAAVVRR